MFEKGFLLCLLSGPLIYLGPCTVSFAGVEILIMPICFLDGAIIPTRYVSTDLALLESVQASGNLDVLNGNVLGLREKARLSSSICSQS
jgi:hypothetical protein